MPKMALLIKERSLTFLVHMLNGYFLLVLDKKHSILSKYKDFNAKMKIQMLSFPIFAVIKLLKKTCQILGLVIFRTSAPDCTTSRELT